MAVSTFSLTGWLRMARVSRGCMPARPDCGRDRAFEAKSIFAAEIFRCLPAAGSEVQFGRGAPVDVLHAVIFVDLRAVALGGAGEAADEFAGIERASGDFVDYTQRAGIIPFDQ